MEALVPQPTRGARAPRHSSVRRNATRAVAVLASGGCLAVFGATGVAGAVTLPDASPIFCVAGVPCTGTGDSTPTTTAPTKKAAEAAKKAAKEAEKAAKKAAKEAEKAGKKGPKGDALNGGDLKTFLGDSSVIDNGGHKWG